MPSPSPISSTPTSQTVCSEEVTIQTLMSVIVDLRTQLTSMSRRQDEMMQLVLDLRRELTTRTEPTIYPPTVITHSIPQPTSPLVPKEVDPTAIASTLSSNQATGSAVEPQTSKPTLPIPSPDRRIRRQNAFYHISNAEEGPWKAPGDYHPYRDGTHPTRGGPTPERPASPSSPSIHPPVSSRPVPSEGNHLPPPYSASPSRHPASQGSQSSRSPLVPPLPQAKGASTLPPPEATTTIPTLPTHPAPSPRARPLHREGAFYHLSWFARAPFRAPGPGIFQPPPYPPTTAPTTPAAPLSPPKRKREDAGDTIDGDDVLDKKRVRRPSSSPDDVD